MRTYCRAQATLHNIHITIVNIYVPNKGAPQYIRETLTGIRGEIDSNKIIVVDFNTPLTPLDR